MHRRDLMRAGSVLPALLLARAGRAQTSPDRPIRLVIPYAPGGPTDVLARALAAALGGALRQSVVPENRPGGGGVVAMTEVARAAPDGTTLLLGGINLSVSPALHRSLPFDPARSFTPIGFVATAPMLVLVPQASPVGSMADLVARARAAPGTIAYAHAGVGSPTHLGPELLKSRCGLDITAVPYRGSGESLTAVAAGHAGVAFAGLSAARGLIDAGRLRPLAITGPTRSAAMPEVPTIAEAGVPLPELEVGSWWGLLGPGGLPPGVTRRLHAALRGALTAPEFAQRLASMNFTPGSGDPEDLRVWIATEARIWAGVLEQAGIRPE
jgi:tripartite-type tricarboxylate transporter receptor subunit TctC